MAEDEVASITSHDEKEEGEQHYPQQRETTTTDEDIGQNEIFDQTSRATQERVPEIETSHGIDSADLSDMFMLQSPLQGITSSWLFNQEYQISSFETLNEELTEQWLTQNTSVNPQSPIDSPVLERNQLISAIEEELPNISEAFLPSDSPFVSFVEGQPLDRITSDVPRRGQYQNRTETGNAHQDDEELLMATLVVEEAEVYLDESNSNSINCSAEEGTIIADAQRIKKWWEHKSFQVVACIFLVILLGLAISLGVVVTIHKMDDDEKKENQTYNERYNQSSHNNDEDERKHKEESLSYNSTAMWNTTISPPNGDFPFDDVSSVSLL